MGREHPTPNLKLNRKYCSTPHTYVGEDVGMNECAPRTSILELGIQRNDLVHRMRWGE